MVKAPQKAKNIVCEYLQACAAYTPKKGMLKSEIASALLKENPDEFPKRIYNLAIDNLVDDKKINKDYSEEPNKSSKFSDGKLRKDLPEDVSGWLYWIEKETEK
ncbi:MAG: hypothetical protein KJ697_00550 [Nanoarchaeota archaeon]|nr:hypothetical protein [Nanoarchaeota archaeon]MBU4124132.1 hypothetical protein [Nanoarchaeota archaeon]